MVSARYSKLVYALQELGYDTDLSSLPNRIVLQKRAYLLQELGLPIGYSFGWYIHGPYSTELTREAYEGEGLERRISIPTLFNQAIMRSEDRYRNFFTNVKTLTGSGKTEDYWLELMSSLQFLASKAEGSATPERWFALLATLKPNKFSEADMRTGWEVLTRHGLVMQRDG